MGYYDLTNPQQTKYLAAVKGSHQIDVRLWLYDRNEANAATLTLNVVGGQIDASTENAIRRTLSLTIVDDTFAWGPAGDLFADNFIGVEYGVFVPDIGAGTWVWDFVFRGPVTKYTRNDYEVTVEAQSKEVRMMPPVQQPILANPNARDLATYVQKAAEDFGETLFDLAAATDRVGRKYDIDPRKAQQKGVWWYLRRLASEYSYDLFYGRDGYLTMVSRAPGSDGIAFSWDDQVTAPVHEFDLTRLINRVEVYCKGKHGTDVLKGVAQLADGHALSPESLQRNGKCLYLLREIRVDHILSKDKANTMAQNALDDVVVNASDVSFDSYPVPFLELGDRCQIVVNGTTWTFTLKQYTLPLLPDVMSVGYTRPTRKKRHHRGKAERARMKGEGT